MLVKCIIMIFIVVRNRICPELVVDAVVCVAGSTPNAAWRRLHLKTRDVQFLKFLRQGRQFLLLIPRMAKEHCRGATADDTNTKRCTLHGFAFATRDDHGARQLTWTTLRVWRGGQRWKNASVLVFSGVAPAKFCCRSRLFAGATFK